MTTLGLGAALSAHFTAVSYDRRGRGASGDTRPYAVQREIEDIEALIAYFGGVAHFGYSSGAALAPKVAADGLNITDVVLYDAPFGVDGSLPPLPAGFPQQLNDLVDSDRRGDAVELYQRVAVGIPEPAVVTLRQAPFRPTLEAMARTLVYDAEVIGDPQPACRPRALMASRARRSCTAPAQALAATMPRATRLTLAN